MALIQSEVKADEANNGITAIAIDGEKNSQTAVKWLADNLGNGNKPYCILLHVQCKTLQLGDTLIPKEGRPPTQKELQQFFLPYRAFCARKGIQTKEVVIHDVDVASALVDYIIHNNIDNIVLGAPRRNAFIRKFKNADVPSILLKTAPESCSIYIISKGKLQTFRIASQPHHTPTSSTNSSGSANLTSSHRSSPPCQSLPPPSSSNVRKASIKQNHCQVVCHPTESLKSNQSMPSHFKTAIQEPSSSNHSEGTLNRDSTPDVSEISGPQSYRSTNASSENLEFSNASASSKSSSSSQLANLLDSEIRRLTLELQQYMKLINSVTKGAVLAQNMLHHLQMLDIQKTEGEQIPEEVEREKQNNNVALGLVQARPRIAEIEAEQKAQRQEEERKRTMEAMENNDFRCRRYTIDEIEVATDHFAISHKIGEGGYGPVFKGILNHIEVAIKILRPDLSQGQKQFRQEVDVLSSMRHRHIVILLGACPEYGCLVYEFMENGSLEDRLFRKYKTPPIPWSDRFRIAYEIATALLFLHETKPEPLVHRDLKPANILLDYNLVSKISDVGLARLLPPSATNNVSHYRMTAAAGTFYYIDPEYQQTGKLSVKSDIYSFGVVLLQILTAKPPMGLAHNVREAIDDGTFPDMLDKSVTDWPVEDALRLAQMAVKCCEMYKKNRPDLASVVLPELRRLRNIALGNHAVKHETVIPLQSPSDLVS